MSTEDMTEAEVKLQDEKMRAEIGKLIAEASKLMSETAKVAAETSKINAKVLKVNSENRWYPLVLGTGFAGVLLTAGVAIAKLFL